jgi:hypothetical protein
MCKLVGLIHAEMHVGASSFSVKTEMYVKTDWRVFLKTRPLNPIKTHSHLAKSIASCGQSNSILSLL